MICSQNDVQCEKVDSRVVPSVTHVDEDDFPEERMRIERSASREERDCEHEVCFRECHRSHILGDHCDFTLCFGDSGLVSFPLCRGPVQFEQKMAQQLNWGNWQNSRIEVNKI